MTHYLDKQRITEDKLRRFGSVGTISSCKEHEKNITETMEQMDSLERATAAITDKLMEQEDNMLEML